MGKKVIVIDDSRTARAQVKNALADAGFDVVEAVDGRDGLAKIEANADAALIFCDVNMPNMSGLEMLHALRESGNTTTAPFVMLTTEAEPELVRQAKIAGAKAWIVKPFKPELLLAAAKKLSGLA